MILVYHIIGLVYYESCNVTPWHFAKTLYKSIRCFPSSATMSCLSIVHLQGESDNRNFGSADHEIKFIGCDVAYRDPRACAVIAYLIQLRLDQILSCHVSVPTQSCFSGDIFSIFGYLSHPSHPTSTAHGQHCLILSRYHPPGYFTPVT